MMSNIAVYPGSFDPITNGHLNVIERASMVFDKVVVAVLENPEKTNSMFSVEERVNLIKKSIKHIDNVEVESFKGLLIHFLQSKDSKVIIKGLRTVADFEYEFKMALMNKKLDPSIETLFMMTDSKYSYISSTAIKQILQYGGCIKDLVPEVILNDIIIKAKNNKKD